MTFVKFKTYDSIEIYHDRKSWLVVQKCPKITTRNRYSQLVIISQHKVYKECLEKIRSVTWIEIVVQVSERECAEQKSLRKTDRTRTKVGQLSIGISLLFVTYHLQQYPNQLLSNPRLAAFQAGLYPPSSTTSTVQYSTVQYCNIFLICAAH